MNKTLLATLLSASLWMASCARPEQAENLVPAGPAVSVEAVAVELAMIPDMFDVPGTVRPKTSTTLSSKIAGQILSISLREGDPVRAGQTVAEIDNREASATFRRIQAAESEARQSLEEVERGIASAMAAVSAAAANRDFAASTLKRYELLLERRSISPQEFDEVQTKQKAAAAESQRAVESLEAAKAKRLQALARIEQVDAELESAKITLSYSRLVSPMNGIVASKPADAGMLATPGMAVIIIESTDYELEALVEESRIGFIKPGDQAEVRLDAIAANLQGRVRNIVPASDPSSRTYQVKLDLPGKTGLRAGYFGRAVFTSGSRPALLAPQDSIVQRGQLSAVYIADGGFARLRLVKTGKQYGKSVEILSGLDAGTRIIVKPSSALADGAPIRQSSEE